MFLNLFPPCLSLLLRGLLLAGGVVLTCLACGTGPLIEFFNKNVSLPMLYGKKAMANLEQ